MVSLDDEIIFCYISNMLLVVVSYGGLEIRYGLCNPVLEGKYRM